MRFSSGKKFLMRLRIKIATDQLEDAKEREQKADNQIDRLLAEYENEQLTETLERLKGESTALGL